MKRDDLEISRDTIHAIEETLSDEQRDRYIGKLHMKFPQTGHPAKSMWNFRHAPAAVCAAALVEVLKGRGE